MGLFASESEKAFKAQEKRKAYLEKRIEKLNAKKAKAQAKGKDAKVKSCDYDIAQINNEMDMMSSDAWVNAWIQQNRDAKAAKAQAKANRREANRQIDRMRRGW